MDPLGSTVPAVDAEVSAPLKPKWVPKTVFDRFTQLVYTLPHKLGYGYMWCAETQFDPTTDELGCRSVRVLLPLHPMLFRTCGPVPEDLISDESLEAIVTDHLNKLDAQVRTMFNIKGMHYWLKPEHQHLGANAMIFGEPVVQSIAPAQDAEK